MESKNELISVIIPVYNVEKYIPNCIDSVINQTYKNIEIILIDDGSIDNSGNMCDEYAKKDNRIKVIHKKNGGASTCRNLGIEKSCGEFITFIDSDDEVTPNYIEYLYNLIKKYNTNISIAAYTIKVNDKKKYNLGNGYAEKKLTTKECLDRLLSESGFTVSSCAKMYNKKLFKNIKYPEGNIYEDDATTYKIIMKCNYIAYGNESIYFYYKREQSVMNSTFSDNKLILLKYADEMYEVLLNKYPELEKNLFRKKINYNFSILRQMVNCKLNENMKKEKKKIIKFLKKNTKIILKDKKMNNKEKIAIISLCFGEKIFKFSWNLYNKIRY